MSVCEEMLSFIKSSPTAFHTVDTVCDYLNKNDFMELSENKDFRVETGKKYYVVRNGSSIIAFKVGKQINDYSFNIVATHTDSPTFKIKEKPELSKARKYTVINTEGYGGMILSSWFDRPLGVAGRILYEDEGGNIKTKLYKSDRDLMLIPSVAIHLNRDLKDEKSLNKQIDLLPVFSMETKENQLMSYISENTDICQDNIIGSDLFLYLRQNASVWGCSEEFVSSPRLDDLQCVFSSVKAFVESENDHTISVMACFDNEEVGSLTKQGAGSTFLFDVLTRINYSLGKTSEDYRKALADSFMLSADNAHAVHPNHPELTDENNCVYINEGVVLKSHAGQKYTSDGVSTAIVRSLARRAGIPLQFFANRSDKAGGSTLGNLVMPGVSLKCADIGIAQLSMHSCYETAGTKDTQYMIELMREMYESKIVQTDSGDIKIVERT